MPKQEVPTVKTLEASLAESRFVFRPRLVENKSPQILLKLSLGPEPSMAQLSVALGVGALQEVQAWPHSVLQVLRCTRCQLQRGEAP